MEMRPGKMIYYHPSKDLECDLSKNLQYRIAWLFPHFDIVKDPAYRIRRFYMHNYLSKMGINSKIIISGQKVIAPGKPYNGASYLKGTTDKLFDYLNEKFDVIVFFNIDEEDSILCKRLFEKGKVCIFDHSENILGLAYEDEIMKNCSAITCCSTSLADITDKYLKNKGMDKEIFVIRDTVEEGVDISKNLEYSRSSNRAIICGGVGNVDGVANFLYKVCQKVGYDFVTLSSIKYDTPWESHQWTPYTWQEVMRGCDVALCMNDPKVFPAKSNVKVTTAMSLGLPTVASPIEAYKEAIKNGESGFIAYNEEDWVKHLVTLLDIKVRRKIGEEGKISAVSQYTMYCIGKDFLNTVAYFLED